MIKLLILGALFGALGGVVNRDFRRFLLPIILTGYSFSLLHNYWILTMLSLIGCFTLGYGENSYFGRIYRKITTNKLLIDLLTRGTIGITVCLSLISIPLINQKWLFYGIGCLGIMGSYLGISWRNLGTYKIGKTILNWSETLLYFGICLVVILITKF